MANSKDNVFPEDIFLEYMENSDGQSAEDVKAIDSLCKYSLIGRNDIEDVVSYVMYNHEKIGFINGYRYAMQKVGVV